MDRSSQSRMKRSRKRMRELDKARAVLISALRQIEAQIKVETRKQDSLKEYMGHVI